MRTTLRRHLLHVLFGTLATIALAFPPSVLAQQAKTTRCEADWLYRGKLGLSTHYFALRSSEKDSLANQFDVQTVAAQLHQVGASWFIFTLHHEPWIMNAPSTVFSELLGSGKYTTVRDIPAELADALAPSGIRLILYVNLRLDPASAASEEVRRALGGWPPNDELINSISAVYREYSMRYGKRIAGWWVDAAGNPAYAKAAQRELWFSRITNAMRAGNPDAIVAFNPGVRVSHYSRQDDYSAGEMDALVNPQNRRWLDGIQWHGWTYLGPWWASDGKRFDDDTLGAYVSKVTGDGGALTLEVGTLGVTRSGVAGRTEKIREAGIIDPQQIDQIRRIRRFLRDSRLDTQECPRQDQSGSKLIH